MPDQNFRLSRRRLAAIKLATAMGARCHAIDSLSHTTDAVEARLGPIREELGPMPAMQGMISAISGGAMPLREESDSTSTETGAASFRIQYANPAAAQQAAMFLTAV